MPDHDLIIRPISTKRDRRRFVELPYRLYQGDSNWVPPLRREALALLTPGKNAWFTHARAQLFLAERGGQVVGRISAHIDTLALTMPPEQGFGPGVGQWGLFDVEDAGVGARLIVAAEGWLRDRGMTRALGPISMSIWEEPGLLTQGYDHPPTVMMGHARPEYRGWIEGAGYQSIKRLYTYELDITRPFPPLIQRIVRSGQNNARIRVRGVDKSRFDQEAAIILGLLNDAWSDNWGFVPLTDPEIADIGVKLRPIVYGDLIRIAELDGRPVAFMITLPDLNEAIAPLRGSLFPFGWARLLRWLRAPRVRTVRVPLMGVLKELQSSRLASQLAFMMIEETRATSVATYGASRAEIGWILDDNQGMRSIADGIECSVNKVYQIYARDL